MRVRVTVRVRFGVRIRIRVWEGLGLTRATSRENPPR